MKKIKYILPLLFISPALFALPRGFVYLHSVDPTILQDMRYAGDHNVVGRPIDGYQNKECILTKEAAFALARVQKKLKRAHLSLKVYDCYRPTKAVDDLLAWSQSNQTLMKAEFYPRENKHDLFVNGYFSAKSGHSRGSTVDLTIVSLPAKEQPTFKLNEKLIACYAPKTLRYADNSIDMGTGFDCLDPLASYSAKNISSLAKEDRKQLREVMLQSHFVPYEKEWWHFTLGDEPYPERYFNFNIT